MQRNMFHYEKVRGACDSASDDVTAWHEELDFEQKWMQADLSTVISQGWTPVGNHMHKTSREVYTEAWLREPLTYNQLWFPERVVFPAEGRAKVRALVLSFSPPT